MLRSTSPPGGNQVSPLSLPAQSDPAAIGARPPPRPHLFPNANHPFSWPKRGPFFTPFEAIEFTPWAFLPSASPPLGPVDASFCCSSFSPFCLFLFFFFFMPFRASCPLGTPRGMPITVFLPTSVASLFGVSYFGCVYRCLLSLTLGPVDASLPCTLFSPFYFFAFTLCFSCFFFCLCFFALPAHYGPPTGCQ